MNTLASGLELMGERRGRRPAVAGSVEDLIGAADRSQGEVIATRYETVGLRTRVQHQRLIEEGFYFEPGEITRIPFLVRLPRGRYDTVVVNANVTTARASVLALQNAQSEEPIVTEHAVVVVTEAPAAGWLQKLTRGWRFIRVEYPSLAHTVRSPTVEFTATRDGAADPDFDLRLSRFYGAATAASQAFVSLR